MNDLLPMTAIDRPLEVMDMTPRCSPLPVETCVAALLAAGTEPELKWVTMKYKYQHEDFTYVTDESQWAHEHWQQRAAEVLMERYAGSWWFVPEEQKDPDYRRKAMTIRAQVQLDLLTQFYTWLCKERGEPWTDKIAILGQDES